MRGILGIDLVEMETVSFGNHVSSPLKQGVFLCFRRIHRIFKSQFHGPSRLSSLTPEQWVGRHATLRGRCSCLPTRYYYTIFDTLCQGKNLGAAFPPRLKRRGFHAEEIDEFMLKFVDVTSISKPRLSGY